MKNVKNDAICHVTRQNQYNPAGGGATINSSASAKIPLDIGFNQINLNPPNDMKLNYFLLSVTFIVTFPGGITNARETTDLMNIVRDDKMNIIPSTIQALQKKIINNHVNCKLWYQMLLEDFTNLIEGCQGPHSRPIVLYCDCSLLQYRSKL